jgi:hypothetical protein
MIPISPVINKVLTILPMHIEPLEPQQIHQPRHIRSLRRVVIPHRRGRFIRVPKPPHIRRDDCEVRREQRNELVPVVIRFRGAVDEEEWRSRARNVVVHADVVETGAAVADCVAVVVVDFWTRAPWYGVDVAGVVVAGGDESAAV